MGSSQEFVRTLKAPSDPPVEDGPTKIEIAEEAWLNEGFYVPSKGEVIAEWILTKLLKEKEKETLLNPIFDLRYWRLLHSICGTKDKGNDHRHLKTWLTPLLHRIPLGPVIMAFFRFLHTLPDGQAGILGHEFTSCISILWPIAVQKMNTEVLLGCFGTLLNAVPLQEELKKAGLMVTASYRNSLGNASNKKKIYQTFLQNHLHSWLQAQSKLFGPAGESTTAFLSAGIDTLLNLDVLRQTYDCKPDTLLMQQLQFIASVDRPLVHEFIPVLFAHYIQALSKHRSALFSQNSQLQPGAALDQLRQCSMNFFSVVLMLVSDQEHGGSAWQTRLALLRMVNEENVFTGKHVSSQMTMQMALESALGALSNEASQRTTLPVQCLSMITRIDQDLVSPVLPKILSRLLEIPDSSDPYYEFLDLLLDHHTKTRTMHVLIENLFEAISSAIICHTDTDEKARDQVLFSSAVMHDIFLEKMSAAIHNFMTENQCVAVMKRASEAVKNAWERAYEVTKEKRKSMGMDVDDTSSPTGESSVKFALITRLASVILSSLPMQSLCPSTLQEVQKSLRDFRNDVLHHDISKCFKTLKKRKANGGETVDTWAIETMLSALLRILYAMNVSRNLSMPTEVVGKNHARLIKVIPSENLLPELTLEMFRTLLFDLSVGTVSNCEEIVNLLLDFLEQNFPTANVRWSGQGYQVTDDELGRRNSSLAVLCMVIDRWLSEINSLASSGQIKRFLKLIMSVKFKFSLSEPLRQGFHPEQLLLHILHSAQFWEFRNIRNVFLDVLKEMTLESASSSGQNLSIPSLIEIVSLYRLLLLFPMEYFSWQVFSQLIKAALCASSALVNVSDSLDKDFAEGVVVFRVFLKKAYGYSGLGGSDLGMDHAELVLDLLKESPMLGADVKEGFENATLDLVEIYLLRLLKSSKKSGADALLRVFRVFESESFGKTRTLSLACFIRLVNLLCREFPANSVPEEIVHALRTLHGVISLCISPDMVAISQVDLREDTEAWRYVDAAKLWYTLLSLRKWFYNGTVPHQQMDLVGEKVISVLMPLVLHTDRVPVVLAELCTTTFAILLGELEYIPGDERSRHLEVVLAIYVALGDNIPAAGLKDMDGHLGRASKVMPVVDYVHLLSFVANSLSAAEHSSSPRTLSLVHLASLLLCDHPSHSFAHIQKFMSECLGTFNDHPLVFVIGDPRLRLQVLEMVAQYCSDQHAALRTQDASMILLLISNFLAPSEESDKETQFGIFHRIVLILTSLIRLRRDLVALSLPHLGLILRRLLLCLRGRRPNLGAKQTMLVMNTQPRWICSTNPLGGEEAKALGRLLESLNIKTTARIHSSTSSSLQPPKAESLARPFSKHAAYVLKVYIEAMNDPLCVISLEVRKELKEGLFALCGMMSIHSRDALMIGGGLDAGGKAVLKSVWKEWEAVKYVGKG